MTETLHDKLIRKLHQTIDAEQFGKAKEITDILEQLSRIS